MQRKGKENPDKTYQSFSFGQDKNIIVSELDRIKHAYDHKNRGQKKFAIKDIAVKLLGLTKEIGELEVSQQIQAAEIHPDLDTKPNHQEGGLELVDLYGEFKWPVRVSQRLLQQFKGLSQDEVVGYLTLIRMLCDGRWPGPSNRDTCMRITPVAFGVAIEHGGFFLINVPEYRNCDLRLLFSVGVQRIPANGFYQYRHYLKFWQALQSTELNDLAMELHVKKCWQEISNDCALAGFETQLKQVPRKGSERAEFSPKRKFEMNIINQVEPLSFASAKLPEGLSFDRGSLRWVQLARLQQLQAQKQRQIATQRNQQIIRKVVDFKSVQQLMNTMTKIPGFRIKCSEEEKKVIGHDGSLIVMGRSGTGKTTCAVLRLFTVQMLFHVRQHLGKQEIELRDTRPGTNRPIGLHSIFATASPCLAREIERYYKEFAYEIKKQTAKKKGDTFQQEAPVSEERSKAYVDISAIRNEMFKFRSMEQLSQQDYPAFLTTRELLFLIDGTLEVPFFDSRPSEEALDARYGHNQTAVRITKIEEKLNIGGNPRQKQNVETKQTEQMSFYAEETHQSSFRKKVKLEQNDYFEVNYESFATHFWPQVRHTPQGKQVTPEMVWTQILSNIKGSTSSYLHPNYAQPKEVYFERSKQSLLSERQRDALYEIYRLYEQWKMQVRAYDLMDAVNYILSRVLKNGYSGPPIHFLMIDEVQDLPYVFILLLTLLVEAGMFFSGDSAQTIAKGVEFRFSEIRRMFNKKFAEREFKLEAPTLMQLSINFRSHNAILQLSNSVVSMIEVLFPNSIDRLRKERSDYDRPKPTVLSGEAAMKEVITFLENKTDFQDYSSKQPGGQKRSKLEFGFYKAILVRDSESKKKLPELLREEYLCLTIQEAKGLEFYDVLIYNFFDESPTAEQWKILRWIKVHSYTMRRQEFEDMFSRFSEENEKVAETDASHSIEGDTVILNKLCQETGLTKEDLCEVRELSSQLKLLYTAITRARNNLMIYDENGENRKPIEKIWQRLEVTGNEKDMQKKKEPVAKPSQQVVSKEEWREQGMVMLNRNLLQQAIKCFKKSGDYDLYTKAEAKSLADQAAQEMAEANAELGQLETSNIFAKLSRNQRRERTKQLNAVKDQATLKFKTAARKYEEIGEYQDAGRCFFSIHSSKEALECFQRSGDTKSIAHCYFQLGEYIEASIYFLQGDYYMDCLESLDLAKQYEPALGVVHKYHKQMQQKDKLNLLDYFFRKAIKKLGKSYIDYEAKLVASNESGETESLEITNQSHGDLSTNQRLNDLSKELLDTQPEIPMTQQELQRMQLHDRLVETLKEKRIQIGLLFNLPERTYERVINLIALMSRHVQLEEREGWASTELFFYPKQQKEEKDDYDTNEEIALGELEYYQQILLCIVMCRREESLYRRLPYYGLSWIYQTLSLPKVSNNLLDADSTDRKNALALLEDMNNKIEGVLSRITDYIAEDIDEVARNYYVQGLIFLGLYKQALGIVDIPVIIEICYTHFDFEELSLIFTKFLNEEQRQYYSNVDDERQSLMVIMRIQKSLWHMTEAFGLHKSLIKCNFNPSLDYSLPPKIRYGRFYNQDIDQLKEKDWYESVSSCIKLLEKIVYGRIVFPSHEVYDVTVFSLFVLNYAPTKNHVLNSIDTSTFLKMRSSFQRIISNLLRNDTRNPNIWSLLEAVLSFYRLRLTRRNRPSHIHDIFGDECLYMHTSSPLLADVLEEQKRLAAKKKDNYVEHIFFVDTDLKVLSVPLEATLKLVKTSITEQLKKCTMMFCALPDPPITSYEEHLSCEYKVILRHYLKMVNDDKFEKEQLYRLLPFNKNNDMPPLLRNHLLRLSRQIRKRVRYTDLQRFNECAALIISGQVSIYREIYRTEKRCELYDLLKEKFYNDLDLFDSGFERFIKIRSLCGQQILPLFEELLLVLMEKYIIQCENFEIYKLRLFESQLAFLKQLKWSKETGYTYVDQYSVKEDFDLTKERISVYFAWLASLLHWKFHGLNEPQLQRIRNLVFIFMININFGKSISYGASLFNKHMRILENCQTDPYLLKKIRELVVGNRFGSSNQLTQLLTECSPERVHIIEFQDISDEDKNYTCYQNDLESEKKKQRMRNEAACVLQKWWKQHKSRTIKVKGDKQSKTTLDDEWKANAFYSIRRAVPFPSSDFLKRVSFNCNEVVAVIRQSLQQGGERSSHIFHLSTVQLRRLTALRNSFSDLASIKFPKKQFAYDELYTQLDEVEEAIEELLIKTNRPRAKPSMQNIPLHKKRQQL